LCFGGQSMENWGKVSRKQLQRTCPEKNFT
jgi:hypothetical protein